MGESRKKGPKASFVEKVLNLFYPRRCPICEEIVKSQEARICDACKKRLRYIKEPFCMCCGRQLAKSEEEYCSECLGRNYHFDRGFAIWQYDALMRRSLSAFKYYSRKEYADFYADEAVSLYERRIRALAPQVLVPVPIHRKRRKMRGFNQAECLAKKLGERLNIPVDTELLVRRKNTTPLKELGARERAKELKNAFSLAEGVKNSYQSIMLVDDIFTTGSTLDHCAEVLKQTGTTRITFFCVAVGAAQGNRIVRDSKLSKQQSTAN